MLKNRLSSERTDLVKQIPLKTPWVVFVDPSSACNFKCKFCPNIKMKNKTIMSWVLYEKIINDLKKFPDKLKVLRLYMMGEPLLNKSFCDMVKYAKDKDITEKIDTTTNGSLLNPVLNSQLIESDIDRINISIEGMTNQQYKDFCDYKIDFQKFIDNIADLHNRKKNTEIFVKINSDFLNEEQKEAFIETFKNISDGYAFEHTANCWPEFEVENVNTEVGLYGQKIEEIKICPYIFYQISIHSDGIVSACFVDWDKKLIIGNVNENSIKEIWNNNSLYFLREDHILDKKPFICRECNQLKYGAPTNIDNDVEEIKRKLYE